MIRKDRFRAAVLLLGALAVLASPAPAQIPDEFQNLQVLPKDVERRELIETMRGFSFALGVRCQYCHVGGDGQSFEGVDFASDDDPDKRKARFMMRMTANLNLHVLALVPERDEPASEIGCKTCHRGLEKPVLLSQELSRVVEEEGVAAAADRYRELREAYLDRGNYDFGEWETNVVAETLARQDRPRDAIAIYELNRGFHPDSASIVMSLAGLYEQVGDGAAAIAAYERVLELAPENRRAAARLKELRGGE